MSNQASLETSFENATSKESKQRNILRNACDRKKYVEKLVVLITRRRLAMNCVTWPEFQDFCLSLNPAIDDLLITSRSTVRSHITRIFNLYRDQIGKSLQSAQSMVHFSGDIWTSPNGKGFFGICVQWVDQEYKLQKALLALPEIAFDHSGKHQSVLLVEQIEWFNIASNLGYFVGDNHGSNDACLRELSEMLRLRYQVSESPIF
jgi:hypothetical protein